MSNTTADKLQLLMNTKNSIRTALINKGQTVNVSDTFSSYSAKIENIETGIDTSDATATATDILEGKTAYVNGVKLIGTMESLTDVIANQTNIINELEAELNDKAGLSFQVPNGMKFGYTRVSDFPSLDTSDVIDMSNMFVQCPNLVNTPSLNTINVTDMSWMFGACSKLVNISNFDTSNVTNTYRMFSQCYNLTTVPNFDTSNVINMAETFFDCEKLSTIPNFNTSKVTSMHRMLDGCHDLTSVPNLDTSKATSTALMFNACRNLTSIPEFNTSNVTNMAYMFSNCYNLVDIPELNTSRTFNIALLCTNCNNLSNESIQNIVNMCINSDVTFATYKNISNTNSYSPLYKTIFDNSYYQNRLAELDAAGWKY